MDTIDLDAIIDNYWLRGNMEMSHDEIKSAIKDGIHQALLLASKNAEVIAYDYEPDQGYYVDKQSILDVEKLIK